MNTVLQKRIEEAANKYAAKIEEQNPNSEAYDIDGNFITGATFALQNQWISVEEALPEFEGNFSDYFLVRTERGWCMVTMYYRTSEKEYWWNLEKTKVTHWMQIPSLKGGE